MGRAPPAVLTAQVSSFLQQLVGQVAIPRSSLGHIAALFFHAQGLEWACSFWRVHVHLTGASTALVSRWLPLYDTSFTNTSEAGKVQGIVYGYAHLRQILTLAGASLVTKGMDLPSSRPEQQPSSSSRRDAGPSVPRRAPPTAGQRAMDPPARGPATLGQSTLMGGLGKIARTQRGLRESVARFQEHQDRARSPQSKGSDALPKVSGSCAPSLASSPGGLSQASERTSSSSLPPFLESASQYQGM